ncbi:MAG: helix-turn-helix transcriptional regulator [Muribaculaceae bacterium]
MDTIHQRLLKSFDYLRNKGVLHTQTEFATAIGKTQQSTNAAFKNAPKRCTIGLMKAIAAAFSDYLNSDWLLTGEGEMEVPDRAHTRPHIPADLAVVSAGGTGVAIGSLQEGECELRPVMAPFPWYDFTINVDGDSMHPTLHDKDTLACRWLYPPVEFKPDHIYILDTKDGAVVKRVEQKGATLLCTSDNPKYKPFTIDESDVLRLALVVGLTRQL